jgi:hypothetical protein
MVSALTASSLVVSALPLCAFTLLLTAWLYLWELNTAVLLFKV